MSRIFWGVALALLFGACLLLLAPARLVAWVLPSEQVVMQGFSGTVWRGSASRALVYTGAGYLHLGELRWSLEPLSLLRLTPSLGFESSWGDQLASGEVTLHASRDLELTDLEATFSAALLQQLAPVAVAGRFTLQAAQLRLRDGLPLRGEGRVVWQNASWQSPQGPVKLGSYALDFSQIEGAPLFGEVLTINGPVRAEGSASLTGTQLSVDVKIDADSPLHQQLRDALALIAAPQGSGFRLALNVGLAIP